MLNKAKTLIGYKLNSRDGEIGKVKEFYFDEHHWTIRYLVIDTGNWLADRQVLISPYALLAVNKEEKYISIDLTKKQIEDCPLIENDKPISRNYEEAYYGYYGYQLYWNGSYIIRNYEKGKDTAPGKNAWNPYLRSTRDITGNNIQTSDGEIGNIDDFIIDDETWAICYLVVDTQKWWAIKKVLVSTHCLESVFWKEVKVSLNPPSEAIKQTLENIERSFVTREYKTRFHHQYKCKVYSNNEPFIEKYVH
jgi:uncharacterized protein YrrD